MASKETDMLQRIGFSHLYPFAVHGIQEHSVTLIDFLHEHFGVHRVMRGSRKTSEGFEALPT